MAVVRVQNDVLSAINKGCCVFLMLLDLSAAFDTVSHQLLIHRLHTKLGVTDTALAWFASYLGDRKQSVLLSGHHSSLSPLCYGVPQGSVLGPDLFSDYSAPVAGIIKSFGISVHCYADDTQLYASFSPGKNESSVLKNLEQCMDTL